MNIKKNIKKNLWFWRFVLNRKPSYNYSFQLSSPKLMEVLNELNRKGIAFSNFIELFPELDWNVFYASVYDVIEKYEKKGLKHSDEQKKYFDFVLGLNPVFEKDSLWNQIASRPQLQSFADAYFKMKGTHMRYYNIWRHRAVSENPCGSQLWHRDREDLKILKIFICMEDVGHDNGPFYYAPGTHIGGKVKKEPRFYIEPEGTHRTTDEMMNEVVPSDQWIAAIGKKGAVVLADTHGYHKGGFVQEGERLLFTCMYVSPSCGRRYFQEEK